MSFTVNEGIASRCFHASGADDSEASLDGQPPEPSTPGRSQRRDESGNNCTSDKGDEQPSDKDRFWMYLFNNVNRAVDELYYLCEAEGSRAHCEEAKKLLSSCARDFTKLMDRQQVQSEYEAARRLESGSGSGTQQAHKGVAWEVRMSSHASGLGSVLGGSGDRADRLIPDGGAFPGDKQGDLRSGVASPKDKQGEEKVARTSTAGGEPPKPALKTSDSMGERVIRHALETMEARAREEREANQAAEQASAEQASAEETQRTAAAPSAAPAPSPSAARPCDSGERPQPEFPRCVQGAKAVESTTLSAVLEQSKSGNASAPSASSGHSGGGSSGEAANDGSAAGLTAGLTARQRRAKRRAEQTATAQELSNRAPSPAIFTPPAPASSAAAWAGPSQSEEPPESGVPSQGVPPAASADEESSSSELETVWAEVEAWVEAEAAEEELAWARLTETADRHSKMGQVEQKGRCSSAEEDWSKLEADEQRRESARRCQSPAQWLLNELRTQGPGEDDGGEGEDEELDAEAEEEAEASTGGGPCKASSPRAARAEERNQNSGSSLDAAADSGGGDSQGEGSGERMDVVLQSRAVHEKLLCPKPKESPAATRARAASKHDLAAKNREALELGRRRRIEEAAARQRLVRERQAEVASSAESAHLTKLSAGHARAALHIAAIRDRAGLENTKVSEVLFINGLTSAGIKTSLEQRLAEVELRLGESAKRRAEKMEAKREQEKKRAADMSERQQVAEARWARLEERIEAVGRRRLDRLTEIARRTTPNDWDKKPTGDPTQPDCSTDQQLNKDKAPDKGKEKSNSGEVRAVREGRPPLTRRLDRSLADETAPWAASAWTNSPVHRRTKSTDSSKGVSPSSLRPHPNALSKRTKSLSLTDRSETDDPAAAPETAPSEPGKQARSSPVPLALPGSLAAASAWEARDGKRARAVVVGRELRRRDEEQGRVGRPVGRGAVLDDGAAEVEPTFEPIGGHSAPKSGKQQAGKPQSSQAPPPPPPSDSPPSSGRGGRKRGGGRHGASQHGGLQSRPQAPGREEDEEESLANPGKKLRKLRTKLLRLAPGWDEEKWGQAKQGARPGQDGWEDAAAASAEDKANSSARLEPGLRQRLDRVVDAMRCFRGQDAKSATHPTHGAAAGAGPGAASESTHVSVVTGAMSKDAALEGALADLTALLSSRRLTSKEHPSSDHAAALQQRLRQGGGLELLLQLTAPRHGSFSPRCAPLALDAVSLCFNCPPSSSSPSSGEGFSGSSKEVVMFEGRRQRDFALATDGGVGLVDAATWALDAALDAEKQARAAKQSAAKQPRADAAATGGGVAGFGTTADQPKRSLQALSKIVDQSSGALSSSSGASPAWTAGQASKVKASSADSAGACGHHPWETLNAAVLLLTNLVKHEAGSGLGLSLEGTVRFLCVTGFVQRLLALLPPRKGAPNKASSAVNLALGTALGTAAPGGQRSPQAARREPSKALGGKAGPGIEVAGGGDEAAPSVGLQLMTPHAAMALTRRACALMEALASFPMTRLSDGCPSLGPVPTLAALRDSSPVAASGRAAAAVKRLFEEVASSSFVPTLSALAAAAAASASASASGGGCGGELALEVCAVGCRALSLVARLDLGLVQRALQATNSPSLSSQAATAQATAQASQGGGHEVAAGVALAVTVLEACQTKSGPRGVESALRAVDELVGFFALGHVANREAVRAAGLPARLLAIARRDGRLSEALPTWLACAFPKPEPKPEDEVVEAEAQTDLANEVGGYLRGLGAAMKHDLRHHGKALAATNALGPKGPRRRAEANEWIEMSQRFPSEYWDGAARKLGEWALAEQTGPGQARFEGHSEAV